MSGTILSRNFEAVPAIPFESETMRLPDGARAVWVSIDSDQDGTFYFELYNPEQERWATFSTGDTEGGASAGGADSSGTVPGTADVTVHDVAGSSAHRVRWMPAGASATSFVHITYGASAS